MAPVDAPAHAAPELVKLRQAEPVRAVYQHHGSVGYVDAHLHNRSRDQNVVLASLELLQHQFLLAQGHAPVQQSHPEVGEYVRRKPLVFLKCRARLDNLGLLDERADHERLPALPHLATQLLVRGGAPVGGDQHRAHRLAARRHLVDNRRVEVAIDRERERPRYRRGRHGKHVRLDALPAQRRPLHHAKAVLLVYHRHRETRHIHAVLDERLRADYDIHLSIRDSSVQVVFCPLAHTSQQQRHHDGAPKRRHRQPGDAFVERWHFAATGQHSRDAEVVLFRQNLRRRHQRSLVAVEYRRKERRRGHDGLAAAHVTLQQPTHWPDVTQVGQNLIERPRLGAGQPERERLEKRRQPG